MLTFKFTEVISVFIVHWRTFRTRILLQDLKFLMKPNLRYSFSLVCFLCFLSLFLFFFLTFFPFSKLGKKNCHTKLIGYSVPFKESKITVKWRICITRVFFICNLHYRRNSWDIHINFHLSRLHSVCFNDFHLLLKKEMNKFKKKHLRSEKTRWSLLPNLRILSSKTSALKKVVFPVLCSVLMKYKR